MNWQNKFSLLAGFFFTFAQSGLATSECSQEGVRTVTVPLHHERSDLGTFDLRYRKVEGSDPSSPTIILLPGGPGQTSIGDDSWILPSEFSKIETDPRGIGCNSFPEGSSVDLYSTRALAKDVIAIIKNENLNNYILFGVSYGTYLATVISSLSASMNIVPPKSIVLDGVLARAFMNENEMRGTYKQMWNQTLDAITPEVKQQFFADEPPLGLTPKQWGNWITLMLLVGDLPNGGGSGLGSLLSMLESDDPAQRESLREIIENMTSSSDTPGDGATFYRAISCREISDQVADDTYLLGGRLIWDEPLCDGLRLELPYDSLEWQVSVPIYYFNGSNDPATPVWQAEHHRRSQSSSPLKIFVTLQGAGHGALSTLDGCAIQIWNSIGENDLTKLSQGLDQCDYNYQMDVETSAKTWRIEDD